MQFNSYIFILVFLPIFIIGYFLLNKIHNSAGVIFIVISGAFYYFYGEEEYFALILGFSIILNSILLFFIIKFKKKKILLIISIFINIAILFYFKYLNFGIKIINSILSKNYTTKDILLPLGISFITFQQIMYLVNVYNGEIDKVRILEYLSYILYFPKLIMGPLVEPGYFIKQLNDKDKKKINLDNISAGIRIFSYGLFKKMVIADTFSKAVAWGFDNFNKATSGDLFLVMLFYTFEIYFDFSGYTDMAIGVSNMINISLPINFDSPYKATSIRDFWKRWHIALTGFLTKYIYYPLGGSRNGKIRTYINIMLVFLISGIWHGANWTFILWGIIYGGMQIIERIFDKLFSKLSDVVKWSYTFFSVNILWLLFRSNSIMQWKNLLLKMFSFKDMSVSNGLIKCFVLPESTFIFDKLHLAGLNSYVRGFSMLIFIVLAYVICLIPENNYKTLHKTNLFNAILCAITFVWGFLCLSNESVFVYFNF